MNKLFTIFLVLLSLPGYSSDQLKLTELGEGVYLHVSYLETESWGKVGCNGLVYLNGGEAIVFDAPTNDEASIELIDWIQGEMACEIKAVVATHFHEDCIGGLQAFHDKEIPSYAGQRTQVILTDTAELRPSRTLSDPHEFNIGGAKVHTTYFGEGHTKDNIVGYIPSAQALFGGCLVKSMGAGKGYLGDANVSAWSSTVARVKETYPDLEIVVPGHGKTGGPELLDFTIELFKHAPLPSDPLKQGSFTVSCSDGTSSPFQAVRGYVVTGASFDSKENIPKKSPLNYQPEPGEQNVLFLHLQPTFEVDHCNSSNLCVFFDLDLEAAREQSLTDVQFSMYTGANYYQFEQTKPTSGFVKVLKRTEETVRLIVDLSFGISDEPYSRLQVETEISLINTSQF